MTGEIPKYDSDVWEDKPMTQQNIENISEDEDEDIITIIDFEDLPNDYDNTDKTTNSK